MNTIRILAPISAVSSEQSKISMTVTKVISDIKYAFTSAGIGSRGKVNV